MALECIWALPPLKTMFCLGFAFLVGTLARHTTLTFKDQSVNAVVITGTFIGATCLYHVMGALITKFKPGTAFSVVLILLYVAYLLVLVVDEAGLLFTHPMFDRGTVHF